MSGQIYRQHSRDSKSNLNYYFYSLYALCTSHDTSNYQNHEHNAYAKFIQDLQLEDNQ